MRHWQDCVDKGHRVGAGGESVQGTVQAGHAQCATGVDSSEGGAVQPVPKSPPVGKAASADQGQLLHPSPENMCMDWS